jgi:solute carrier family 35 protein E1
MKFAYILIVSWFFVAVQGRLLHAHKPMKIPRHLQSYTIQRGGQSQQLFAPAHFGSQYSKQPDAVSVKSERNTLVNEKVSKGILFGGYMMLWYFFTVAYNISNKMALRDFPLPAFVVWTQLLISSMLVLPLWLANKPALSREQLKNISVLSLLHTMGVFTSALAMKAGSISFLQIIKASEPVFVAAVSLLLGGKLLPLPVYLTLIPVISGVALASVTDLSFSWQSFAPAIASNTLHPVRMVLFKKYMGNWADNTNATSSYVSQLNTPTLSSSNVFQLVTLLGVLIMLPLAVIKEGHLVSDALKNVASVDSLTMPRFADVLQANDKLKGFLLNLLISGVSYFFYNEVGHIVLTQ